MPAENKDLAGEDKSKPGVSASNQKGNKTEASAEDIKDAHATGIGSLGRNDEKLGSGGKLSDEKLNEEEGGLIKD